MFSFETGVVLLGAIWGGKALDEFTLVVSSMKDPKTRIRNLLLSVVIIFFSGFGFFPMIIAFGVSQLWLLTNCMIRTIRAKSFSNLAFAEICTQSFGLWYIPFNLGHGVLLGQSGAWYIWYVLILTEVGADTFALIIGKLCGRTRPVPEISPNKSTEGFVGAVFGSVLFSLLFHLIYLPYFEINCPFSTTDFVVLGILLGFLGIIGDLLESLLKRCYNIKDTGNVLPGMGGILDRIDALLFTFPTTFYYLYYVENFR